ncbi:MAG: hypothetical protein NTV46_14985 [Verrucomicrobia bacterium]|nr:hypothetical protein [Verrucomicrobiota bacterium]
MATEMTLALSPFETGSLTTRTCLVGMLDKHFDLIERYILKPPRNAASPANHGN